MKQIFRLFVIASTFFTLGLFSLRAEAATVALLPLLNNVGEEDAGQIYFQCALEIIKEQGNLELIDNEKINAAMQTVFVEEGIGENIPSAAGLKKIAEDGGVDIVIAMQLDKLTDKVKNHSKVRYKQLDLRGNIAAYNALNYKVYRRAYKNDRQIELALASRWDFKREEWGRTVRLEVEKALKAK